MPNDETIEQPKETCGLMLFLEGGIQTTINLFATRDEVVEKIQIYLRDGVDDLVEFKTANPDEQETFLVNPKKILFLMVKKEFVISTGKIVPASMAQNPANFKH